MSAQYNKIYKQFMNKQKKIEIPIGVGGIDKFLITVFLLINITASLNTY